MESQTKEMNVRVYLLWHTRVGDLYDDDKLCGVFSSDLNAKRAIAELSALPGFRDNLDGFEVAEYVIDKLMWTTGFGVDQEDE